MGQQRLTHELVLSHLTPGAIAHLSRRLAAGEQIPAEELRAVTPGFTAEDREEVLRLLRTSKG